MKKRFGTCFIAIGTALLIAALSIVLYNLSQDKSSGERAHKILAELKSEIPEDKHIQSTESQDLFSEYDTVQNKTEPTAEADDHSCIGIISVPSLGIELPVLSSWSYADLKISPCRYKGTADGGDLIIAAHNYRSHFGGLSGLVTGDRINFTDVNGKVYEYETIQTETIVGEDIELMEFGASDEWDITLFTCTLSGRSRVTVRAVLIDKN